MGTVHEYCSLINAVKQTADSWCITGESSFIPSLSLYLPFLRDPLKNLQ